MSGLVTIRYRRIAGERHAMEGVEREIRATDPKLRLKYLRDYNNAFREYQAVLSEAAVRQEAASADVLLLGDYHALPNAQRYAAQLLRQVAEDRGEVLLGVEMVFARDQHILDEWWRGEIDEQELRDRIRFDTDWGYDWQPFYELLDAARSRGARVYGLDCGPRFDMRRIAARDRHAAGKIAELRQLHPGAVVLVLFGESHLAPNHLPELLRQQRPGDRVLTVLQNKDQLYWKAAGEKKRIEAVRVTDDVVCVFNSTPLEKYESYRRWIERWRGERASGADVAPTIYNLIDALTRFLNINKYASTNHTQPRFLVDLMPEVCARPTVEALQKALSRHGASHVEVRAAMDEISAHGSVYMPRMNLVFIREFQLAAAAEHAARFLHHACRGNIESAAAPTDTAATADDLFYTRTLEHALAYFGARVLYPARAPVRESDLYVLYAQPREAIEEQSLFSYREYMQMLDFLVLHKDFETNLRQYWHVPPLLLEGVAFGGEKFEFTTRRLGYMFGTDLYDAYIAGRLSKRFLRSLFFRRLDREGAAHLAYFQAVRRMRKLRRRPAA